MLNETRREFTVIWIKEFIDHLSELIFQNKRCAQRLGIVFSWVLTPSLFFLS